MHWWPVCYTITIIKIIIIIWNAKYQYLSYIYKVDILNRPGYANWIFTKSILPSTNDRAAFHILNNMDLNLGKALADSKFIPYELIVITSTKAVFYIARTNFYIQNAYITRDVLELSNFITFIQLVYQQEKWLDIRNASFNITGKAIESYDPVNIYFDSLYIATYTLRTFMYMITSWNYPEASLSGLVYANNVTVDTTNQQLNDDALIIFLI